MCTGIFLFKPRPILALNFDYSRTFRLTLEEDSRFCMRIRYGDVWGLPLGVSRNGRSVNIQLAPFKEKAVYDPGKENRTELPQIVRGVLEERLDVRAVPGFLRTHPLTYTPDNTGAHCLCADRTGSLCIADPGTECLTEADFPDGFAVLTNFTLAEKLPLIGKNLDRIRCPRFRTAYRMLLEDRSDPERLMKILEAVRQTDGKMPTIFSMTAELDTGEICFALNGDFSKQFRFSFSDGMLRTGAGHEKRQMLLLTQEGISPEELARWQ